MAKSPWICALNMSQSLLSEPDVPGMADPSSFSSRAPSPQPHITQLLQLSAVYGANSNQANQPLGFYGKKIDEAIFWAIYLGKTYPHMGSLQKSRLL